MKTVYLSGAMRGIPFWNFDSFDDASEWLRKNGYNVISPAEHDREVDPDCVLAPEYLTGGDTSPGTFHKLIGWDLAQIASPECDGVVLLPGWEASVGVAHELYTARACGKPVDEYRTGDGTLSVAGSHWLAELDEDVQLKRQNAAKVEKINDAFAQRHGFGTTTVKADASGTGYVTKDSGERVEFDSGMRRDTQEGKPRYDLIPTLPLRRLADLYTRGAVKYGDYNWQKANSPEELARFKSSAFRHFIQWFDGEADEDHGIAVCWNIFAVLWLEHKLDEPHPQGRLDS